MSHNDGWRSSSVPLMSFLSICLSMQRKKALQEGLTKITNKNALLEVKIWDSALLSYFCSFLSENSVDCSLNL